MRSPHKEYKVDEVGLYLLKYPDLPSRTLARIICKERPEMFDNIEMARRLVRYMRGTGGRKDRQRVEHEPGAPHFLPDSIKTLLIINDLHIPFHNTEAIEEALITGEEENVDAIILNGDIADVYQLSRFQKVQQYPLDQEIEDVKAFLTLLRQRFPNQIIYYKEGNHEERMEKYMARVAPELLGLTEFRWDVILGCGALKIEYVKNCQPIVSHGLWIYHGHEFGGHGDGGFWPARWLMDRTETNACMGHMHRTSEWHKTPATDNPISANSIGCLCALNPQYHPIHHPEKKWNHGFAISREGLLENIRV